MSKNNIVRRTIDPDNPPPLTDEQKARLEALDALTDDQIDHSDIPSVPDAVWARAASLPAAKQQITLRIDADVLDFFRHTGRRYQTRINSVLRAYVNASRKIA